MARAEVRKALLEGRIIAILRGLGPEHAQPLAAVLAEEGVSAVEVTWNSPDAAESVQRLRTTLDEAGLVGAGTVMGAVAARQALDAGAQFLVTPGVDASVVEVAHRADVPVLMGTTTATEVAAALHAGADLLKLFPAGPLGPDYLKALRGPFDTAEFVPTGGLDASNVAPFVAAGATAVGVGGALTAGDRVRDRRWDEIRATTREIQEAVRAGTR